MWRAILSRLNFQRSRSEGYVLPAFVLCRMTSLGILSRNGGPGSDLAGAELKGMQTVILALRRAA